MSSDRRRTKEHYSEKKSARQGKKWIFPVVLLFCVLFLLTGATGIYFVFSPSRYSDREIDDYVKNIYGESWSLRRKKNVENEQENMTSYLYENKEKGSFSVFSMSVPRERNGLPTGLYRKALTDNYYSTVIENHLEDIRDLADQVHRDGGPELEIEETGVPTGAFGAQYIFRLYLEDSGEIDAAASLLAQIDELLDFSCRKGTDPWSGMHAQTPFVNVYLKPDRGITGGADAVTRAAKRGTDPDAPASLRVPGDWRSQEVLAGYEIGRISFSDLSSPSRLIADSVSTRMENDYVDAARTFGSEHYSVSEELLNKYPAPILTLVNAGGHNLSPEDGNSYVYRFVYHRKTGTYWMTGLDPCEDYDGNPYGDYPQRGAFANLVSCLGGSFTADDWSGSWRIGSTRWEASLETKKTASQSYAYKNFSLTCDGNITPLDKVPEIFEGTGAVPSGRPFSIHDLIRMLDVRITINQKNMTAVMFRDFENDQ